MTLNVILPYAINYISIFYIGNLNDQGLLAGVGLGLSIINMVAAGFGCGLVDANTSLMSQSVGAGKFEECGVFFMRSKVVLTFFIVICLCLFVFLGQILPAIGQDPAASEIAAHLCICLTPATWAFFMFEANSRYMAS